MITTIYRNKIIRNKSRIRNCRDCSWSYIPSSTKKKNLDFKTKDEMNSHYTDDYQCIVPATDKEGNILEPVGFCDACDKNNPIWYDKTRKYINPRK